MTVGRAILAASMILIGLMIWGVHRDIGGLTAGLTNGGKMIASKIDGVSAKIDRMAGTKQAPPMVTGKPRVPPVKYLAPAPKPKAAPSFWDNFFPAGSQGHVG